MQTENAGKRNGEKYREPQGHLLPAIKKMTCHKKLVNIFNMSVYLL